MTDESPELVHTWDGARYQARFDELAASGADVHGEADFVMRYAPESVLDAGCGTGRVALELARRGVVVVGADREASMLATAEERANELRAAQAGTRLSFERADLAGLDLGVSFDVVLMAGNVLLFTPAGSEAAVVLGCARHLAPSGLLVAGFQLGRSYGLEDYDRHCRLAGLELAERFATWDGDRFGESSDYAVSVHRRA